MHLRHDIGNNVRLRRAAIDKLVIHRTAQKSLDELNVLFQDVSVGTGGKFPYHIVIFSSGTTVQCVPLNRAAPGALLYNDSGIQIALTGDFRFSKKPTVEQQSALESICGLLFKLYGRLQIVGHTEMPGASTETNKICPGTGLDLKKLRDKIAEYYITQETLAYV